MQVRKDKDYIEELITNAKNIAVLCGNHGNDGLSIAISLAEWIEFRWAKVATVIYPYEFDHIDADLLEIRSVFPNFDPKALTITIDYSGTGAETAGWQKTADAILSLELKPIDNDFDINRIKTEIKGVTYDLIIMVGIKSLEALGEIYTKNKEEIDNANIINIDNSKDNQNYGKLNIVNPAIQTLSGLLFTKYAEWGYVPVRNAAASLLIGLKDQ